MGKRSREAQVGLAVIFAFVILIVGVLWFKQFRFAGGMATYQVDFPAVEGLQVRDRVQVRGIRISLLRILCKTAIQNPNQRLGDTLAVSSYVRYRSRNVLL